ncbi:hypothetical protein EDD11_008468 [Mortierella claussenii]|nr:hypothetical protein EDD11_008468 [Mortierella claussenii]
MGILLPVCIVTNGTRLLAVSYAYLFSAGSGVYRDQPHHVTLIQSNEKPSSLIDVSWSLVSTWVQNITFWDTRSPAKCHVDSKTGVFTVMSSFIPKSNDADSGITGHHEPGGFQYDPRTREWSNFTLAADYRWGDFSATFTLFTWPGTDVLYQANIAQSAISTINLGMLTKKEDGTGVFVNSGSWALDLNTHGYPQRLVFGDDVLYQFGSIVSDNRTGVFKTIVTRIPLAGPNGTDFIPPTNLATLSTTENRNCSSDDTYSEFGRDILYLICQSKSRLSARYDTLGMIFRFRNDGAGNLVMDPVQKMDYYPSQYSGYLVSWNKSSTWLYMPSDFMPASFQRMFYLEGPNSGQYESVLYDINISEPLAIGDTPYDYYSPEPSMTLPITLGVIFAFLVIAGAFFFVAHRRWPRFKVVTWPRWKRAIKVKIIEFLTRGDDEHTVNYLENEHIGAKNTTRDQGPRYDKIEELSTHNLKLDDVEGKILVTADMELSDLEDAEQKVLDVDTGYMQDVQLVYHPRPAIAISLSATEDAVPPLTLAKPSRSLLRDPLIGRSSSSSSSSIASVPLSAPLLIASLNTMGDGVEKSGLNEKRSSKATSSHEDSNTADLSNLLVQSFPPTAIPSAPSFEHKEPPPSINTTINASTNSGDE